MRGKLIQEVDFYGLKIDDKIVGLSDDTTNNILNYPHKLSLKNCEAIERGYDLDELAKKAEIDVFNGFDGLPSDLAKMSANIGFIQGFQKALEILGERKFSEDDMINSYHKGFFSDNSTFKERIVEVNDYIKSLQQTEWDVEILMEKMNLDEIRQQGKGFLNASIEKPKLDENGCLILKSVE